MLKLGLKVLLLVGVLLAVASPSFASGLGIVFDPTPSLGCGENQDLYCLVNNGTYSVAWQNCAVEPAGVLPSGSTLIGDTACIGVANDTGAPIPQVSLVLDITGSLVGAPLTCTNNDNSLSINNCTMYSSGLPAGFVTLSFTATDPSNDIPTNMNFYFAVTGGQAPPIDLQVPTHDPSTLVLLAVGMAMLAIGGVRRYA